MKKLLFLCLPGLQSFIEPIADALQGTYEVTKLFTNQLDQVFAEVQKADVVWLEWANEMAIQATRQLIPPTKRVILRLHSYEALTPQLLRGVNWDVVNDVIFVSSYIKEYVNGIIPQQLKTCKQHVIPNGVRMETLDFPVRQPFENSEIGPRSSFTLGMLGHLNNKKGLMNLCQAFYAVYNYADQHTGAEVKLKVGGTWQDPRYENYFFHFMEKTYLFLAVEVMQVPQGGASKFFSDVDVVLCTSPWESQNMSVMEGMACGCKPAVHWFPGAERHYQQESIWLTYVDLINVIYGPHKPEDYRDYIYSKFGFADALLEIGKVIG